jgi:hypothetical protein
MSDDWDWSVDTNIVQRAQMDLAVYTNNFDQIVIRERRDWPHEEDDKWIVIGRENAVAVAKAILTEAGLDIRNVDEADHTVTPRQHQPARDGTAAARQKRYRNRHRNGAVTDAVTANGRDSHGENRDPSRDECRNGHDSGAIGGRLV